MRLWKQAGSAAALIALTGLPISVTVCAAQCAPAPEPIATAATSSAPHHGPHAATHEASEHHHRSDGPPSEHDCDNGHASLLEATTARTPVRGLDRGSLVVHIAMSQQAAFGATMSTLPRVAQGSPGSPATLVLLILRI